MRRRLSVAPTLVLLLAAGCGGAVENGVVAPPPPPLLFEVTGTTCEGSVTFTVNGVPNDPDGLLTDFPWAQNVPAQSGDRVTITACNTCVVGGCPMRPCDVTITVAIFWKGTLLASATTTGASDPSCLPAASASATIP